MSYITSCINVCGINIKVGMNPEYKPHIPFFW
uniref:Uncharacterized protein n=1 Tax=Cryptosporidium parvum TaxID=5807 RepID=F0X6B5_CRYPV